MLRVWTDNWYVDGKEAWFVTADHMCKIFKCSFDDEVVECVSNIPSQYLPDYLFRAYPKCFKIDNSIILCPYAARDILVYDIKEDMFQKVELDIDSSLKSLSIMSWHKISEEIYALYSVDLQAFIMLDIRKLHVQAIIPICDRTDRDICRVVYVDGVFYGCSREDGNIYEVEVSTQKRSMYKIDNVDRLSNILFDGDIFWLLGWKKAIYSWELGSNKVKEYTNFPVDFGICDAKTKSVDLNIKDSEYELFLDFQKIGNTLFCFPGSANQCIGMDCKTGAMERVFLDYDSLDMSQFYISNPIIYPFILNYCREERYIGLYWMKKRQMIEYDIINKTISNINLNCNHSKCKSLIQGSIRENNLDLKDYIRILT